MNDAAGSRTFAYNGSLQLETETMTGLYDGNITRQYDTLGRSAGFAAGDDYSVTYAYDTTGRFNNVGWTAEGLSGNSAYAYVLTSNLLQSMTSDSGLITTYSYEPNRNVRTNIENAHNAKIISNYAYAYDIMGRRTSVKNSGAAFAQDAFNIYDYNDHSELTDSNRYNGTVVTDTANPVNAEARTYQYDNIGNRESATEALTEQITYDPNPLNQYAQIESSVGWVKPTEYDEDGNLTNYDGKVYSWNAENRLVAVVPETPANGDAKIEYVYDYMGRRVSKQEFDYAGDAWVVSADTRFLYDGWNLIREVSTPTLDLGLQTSVSYVWGLDLSVSLQGAGGIGGLLSRIDGGTSSTSSVYLYTYDGNGNVGQLVDAAGSIAAHYEYDPFGNTINSNGLLASDNHYRFSTKYLDAETDLYYYGYRYYMLELGRWISRDPIEEDGGLNLYGFVQNDVIDIVDPLGQYNFVASGTGAYFIGWKEAEYLDKRGGELLGAQETGSHGSSASFAGYFLSLGVVSYWDAAKRSKDVTEQIIEKNHAVDRGLGHSQGVAIALEGVRKEAKRCHDEKDLCCKKEKTIKLALLAPKTSAGYIDKKHKNVIQNQSGWSLDILIVYAPSDWLIPTRRFMPWPGSYMPSSYAKTHYELEPVKKEWWKLFGMLRPISSHSSNYLLKKQEIASKISEHLR